VDLKPQSQLAVLPRAGTFKPQDLPRGSSIQDNDFWNPQAGGGLRRAGVIQKEPPLPLTFACSVGSCLLESFSRCRESVSPCCSLHAREHQSGAKQKRQGMRPRA